MWYSSVIGSAICNPIKSLQTILCAKVYVGERDTETMKKRLTLVLYTVLIGASLFLLYSLTVDRGNLGAVEIDSRVLKLDQLIGRQSRAGQRHPNSIDTPRERDNAPSLPIVQGCPRVPKPMLKYIPPVHSVPLSPKEKLLAMCGQTELLPLSSFFTDTMINTMTKIGEGAFADVFGCQKEGWDKLAIKIIPIEGDFKYNDEPQNTFQSMQPETVVSIELSLLGDANNKLNMSIPHYTKNFVQMDAVALVQGKFPDFLVEAWDDYDFRKDSDNDRPVVFPESQLYVLFSAENSGVQLGSYVYHSLQEAISVLQQVTATIAIGEAALEFEHRDMHRGNVLVRRTHEKYHYFRLNNKEYYIESHGVQATIVDYTLSRVKQDSECVSFTDLNNMPWLFKGKGDIQFDVYRNMRNDTKNKWEEHHPFTNVLWINYIATKMSIKAKLKGPSSKTWKQKLEPYVRKILRHRTVNDVFLNIFSPERILKKPVSRKSNKS
ncbi:serine/threonine-protein kinase haspin-like [Halichondria panicea]|uniref:serine/threonine-protein kinase haspin-like n=1 Tax=Halichondria panicea TaxID=6063 RepID=UPI00312B7CC6